MSKKYKLTTAMRKKFWEIRRAKEAAREKLEAEGKPIPPELLTHRARTALRRASKAKSAAEVTPPSDAQQGSIDASLLPDRPAKGKTKRPRPAAKRQINLIVRDTVEATAALFSVDTGIPLSRASALDVLTWLAHRTRETA